MRIYLSFLVFLTLFANNKAIAAAPLSDLCGSYLDKYPIQQNGRVKPLYVHSKEMLKYLTGSSDPLNKGATQTYCRLSLKGFGLSTDLKLQAKIEHVELKEILNFKKNQKYVEFEKLQDFEQELKIARVKNNNETSLGKSVRALISKRNIYTSIVQGENWLIPLIESQSSSPSWVPIRSVFQNETIEAITANKNSIALKEQMQNVQREYEAVKSTPHLLEYYFAKARLTSFALLATIIALALFISLSASKATKWGMSFTIITLILQTTYLILRMTISGRAPITNMYETVLFSGYGALWLSIVINFYRKENFFIKVGLAYNILTLMMLHFSGGMLSASISPLVPVLRDNFWLSTHVTTVILSYGAYALSWMLANYVLFKVRFSTMEDKEIRYFADLNYTCLKYGCVLLAAGLLLGGVWADYSWGRFWGWDPKETWSLIVLCLYMAILHGRYTSWISAKQFVPLTALCFLSVMMAWFGVNYILASGLHSYGFSEGGALFLFTFFSIQILIVLICIKPFIKKSSLQNINENKESVDLIN